MLRFRAFLLAAGLAALPLAAPLHAGATATHVKPAQSPQSLKFQTAVMAAITKLQSSDAAGALALLDDAANDPDFASQPANVRYGVLVLRGQSEAMTGDEPAAYDTLTAAGAILPEARESFYWFLYASLAYDLGKSREAVEAYTQLYEGPPGDERLEPQLRTLYYLVREARFFDDGGAAKRRLLEALWSARYTPEEPVATAEGLWYDLLEIRVEAGELDAARELLPQITDPGDVMTLRIDNRFVPLRGDPAARLDYAAAVDAEIARLTAAARAHPDNLEAVVALAGQLNTATRADEALKVVGDAIAAQEAAPADKPAFSDAVEQMEWAYMVRSLALNVSGRQDEALADMLKARDAARIYGDPISQKVNLGDTYIALGRPADALEAVADVGDDDGSDYGDLAVAEVRACAYAQNGDKASLDKTLKMMSNRADKAYPVVLSALTCAGDGDGLARTLIAMLDNPEDRAAALIRVQTYLPLPHPTPVQVRLEAVWKAALARPDVQAAIARYGVVESFPVYAPGT